MEKYIFEGKGYDVPSEHLQVFLQKHPGAKKYKAPGKTTSSAGVTPTGGPENMGYNSEIGSLAEWQSLAEPHQSDKKITWEQAKADSKLYNSLSREEKRTLAKQSKNTVVKNIDKSPASMFFHVLQQTQPGTARALSAVASFAKGTVDIVDTMGDFAETMTEINVEGGGMSGLGIVPYVAKRMAAQKAGVSMEEYDETNPYNILELKGLSNVLDKAVIKHKDKETGRGIL